MFVSFSENLGQVFDDGVTDANLKIIFGSFRSQKGIVFSFNEKIPVIFAYVRTLKSFPQLDNSRREQKQ